MTRKLEELFDLPPSTPTSDATSEEQLNISSTQLALKDIDDTIDKIDQALPAVQGLNASDQEMDDLAVKATETFEDLMSLGMNVDSRYASEIFAVASTMLGHAITAKTAKLNKKLKMIDLQMKKAKLDLDAAKNVPEEATQTAHGQILSRNDLLEMIKGSRDQNNNKA